MWHNQHKEKRIKYVLGPQKVRISDIKAVCCEKKKVQHKPRYAWRIALPGESMKFSL